MSGFLNTKLISQTHPILLRNPEPKDASALASILSNPANIEFDPTCSLTGTTPEQALTTITAMRASASAAIPSRLNLVIVLLSSPGAKEEIGVIGLGGFGGIDKIEDKRWADVGAMLDPEHRGKGYAVESIKLSVGFALRELSVHGVSCQMLEKNDAMVALVEKRFGWEGVKSKGKYGREVRYEVGREEWEKTKERIRVK